MAASGQATITAHGTAERLTTQVGQVFLIRALPTNTGVVYVGNDGADDVSSANGFPLSATDSPIMVVLDNLNQLWLDSAVDSEGIAWLVVE